MLIYKSKIDYYLSQRKEKKKKKKAHRAGRNTPHANLSKKALQGYWLMLFQHIHGKRVW